LYQINATQTYAVGIDNSDSDNFKITNGINPSDGDILFQFTPAGVPSFPAIGALPISAGGTGVNTITANSFIVGDGTNPVNEIGPLTDGQLIIGSTGNAPVATTLISGLGVTIVEGPGSITINASSVGTFQTYIQVIESTGTYTPTAGMEYCQIEVLGGGGAGGGANATSNGYGSVGGGGGAGEYARGVFSAATIGASQAVTIGAGGAGVSASTGSVGGNTSVGALISAYGGRGGTAIIACKYGSAGPGLGGTGGAGGEVRTPGFVGLPGCTMYDGPILMTGTGASSQFGAGGLSNQGYGDGNAALGYGAGGGGGGNHGVAHPARTGGAGAKGVVIITEYIVV
jgi:hypothetical protein